jgi:hypothetical protein
MEFGFLLDNCRSDFDKVEIKPRHDHNMIVEDFYETAHVCDGWLYPALKLKQPNMLEQTKFKCTRFEAEPHFFTVNPTHTLPA